MFKEKHSSIDDNNNNTFIFQDTEPRIDTDKLFQTLFKSVQIKKAKRVFLPPIVQFNSINNENNNNNIK